jgi:DNA-binding NarL/FixJ family response regulator
MNPDIPYKVGPMPAMRIMLVEHELGQMQSVVAALANQPDFEIIASVSTRENAVKQLSSAPAILIIDPAVLEEYTLLRFIRSVVMKSPNTRVMLFLTKMPADESLISDIRTGVWGYLRSADSTPTILKALRGVYEGTIWAERRILEKAISRPMIMPERLQCHVPGFTPLTNREVEMLTMVLQGASNREIADRSSISERTVKTHLYRVYRKLNVNSRTKAIALLSHS